MDLPIIQRRDYGDYDQSNDQQVKETNLNATSSENNKYAIIHFSIILSVLIFVGLVGLLLYMYRRKLQRLKSFNLNRVVNITHVKNADDGIYSSLDYYSNAYENYNISHAYPSDDKFSAYPYPSNDKFSAYPYPSDNQSSAYPSNDKFSAYPYPSDNQSSAYPPNDKFSDYPYPSDNQSSAYPSNDKFSDYPYPSNDKFSAYPSDDKSSAYPLNDKFSAYPSDDKYSAYSSDDKSSAYPSDDKSSIYSSDDKIYPQLDPVHENEDESELKPSGSPTSSISRGNRNYFIYAKSGKIKRTISTLKKDTISRNNSEIKSSNNNITNKSKLDNNITNNNETNKLNSSIKLNNGKKRTKLNINQISTPITSPSESIYNNEKADSLSRTTTRVLPPIPTFSSNKYIQPREILRGSDISENYLIRQYSDDSAATIVANTFDATITAFDDNPIIDITKESDLNNMKTTEEMDLDLMPTNRI